MSQSKLSGLKHSIKKTFYFLTDSTVKIWPQKKILNKYNEKQFTMCNMLLK